ncbi:MarR family transcriptional regulator [Streptomyces sp. ISL-43]|uniref:MarR family winged helix-turn-helix transcriptional regulator n=1 Tax=Streptomyces sp. ISL-43 TaxID=2819183 RepID=UPI001BE7BF0E|nr:MarR family transcriptional regulator [Streptomyces sp. ISL-43]MBT2447866.1 MarR family transcriptional regulator [Streptomyces sp. ISL-43]
MSTRPSSPRSELIAQIEDGVRDNGGRGQLLHQAIAQHFGLNPTDMKCVDLARSETRLTAGRLAEITGMSTSATTAVLDRMERAGFIERVRDPEDRRRVIVVSTGRREQEVAEAFLPLKDAMRSLLESYDDAQLELIGEFTSRVNSLLREVTREIPGGRGGSPAAPGSAAAAATPAAAPPGAPRAAVTR